MTTWHVTVDGNDQWSGMKAECIAWPGAHGGVQKVDGFILQVHIPLGRRPEQFICRSGKGAAMVKRSS